MTAEMTDLIRRIARPEARDLPAYNAGLSSDAVRQRYGVDTIARLGSNENPFGPSPAVGAALRDMADAIGQYPDANSTALRAAIAARTGVEPADIVVGNGSENLLELLCLAFLSPGDRVVTLLPSFGLHEIFPRMMGAQVDMVPVTDSMEFDIDAWCAALGGGARPPRMAILSNPSNPVGCMLDADAFDRVVRAAPPETLLVIDEAYYEYARLTPGFPDVLTRLRAQERPWIVLRTFSKAWGLAGLRVGYGLASHAELVRMLDRVRTPFNVNLAAQRAALAAWGDADHMERPSRKPWHSARSCACSCATWVWPWRRPRPISCSWICAAPTARWPKPCSRAASSSSPGRRRATNTSSASPSGRRRTTVCSSPPWPISCARAPEPRRRAQ